MNTPGCFLRFLKSRGRLSREKTQLEPQNLDPRSSPTRLQIATSTPVPISGLNRWIQ